MDAEKVREIVRQLPYVVETVQWGDNLVFWVGDKAIGGKMFALVNMDDDGKALMSFSAGPEGYAELLEIEGVIPAPYMARIHWVALERWDALGVRELTAQLVAAHARTLAKLPKRTREMLTLPAAERRRLIVEQRQLAATRAAAAAKKPKAAADPDKAASPKRRKANATKGG